MPAERLVRLTVFEAPGKFIAEDSVTVIRLSSLASPVAAEVAMVQRRCLEALRFMCSVSESGVPAFFRVVHHDNCLQALTDSTLKGEHEGADDS